MLGHEKPWLATLDYLSHWKPPAGVVVLLSVDPAEGNVQIMIRACCVACTKMFEPGDPLDDAHVLFDKMAADAIRTRDEQHALKDEFAELVKRFFKVRSAEQTSSSPGLNEASATFEEWMKQFQAAHEKPTK